MVDSYTGMLEHKKYEHRLEAKGPTIEEIAECKVQFDLLIKNTAKNMQIIMGGHLIFSLTIIKWGLELLRKMFS